LWPLADLLLAAAARGVDVSKLAKVGDEWMTLDKFKKEVLKESLPVNPPASAQADTRNELMLNELLQTYELPARASPSNGSQAIINSTIRMHGKNGLGANYFFEIAPSSQNTVIGKKLHDDWWVKAVNVRLQGRLEEEYYLLSHSEGFTFKNKLIRSSDFQATYGSG
jgi:hypothetical protein